MKHNLSNLKLVLIVTFAFFSITTLFVACKKKDAPCGEILAAADIQFRILDATTNKDLIISKQYSTDSISGVQPCNNSPLGISFYPYLAANGKDKSTAFRFPNLRTPQLSEPVNCFEIYITLNPRTVDTVYWTYHKEYSGDCELQIVDGVYYNNVLLPKSYDGMVTYYGIIK